jgi:hypothetical protein
MMDFVKDFSSATEKTFTQGRRNTFEIGGAEFLEAPPWLAPSGNFFEN